MMVSVVGQLGESFAVVFDHNFSNFGQEGFIQTDFAAESGCPADDHAGDIVAAHIAGDHAIGDQECRRPHMVGDHTVRGEIVFPFLHRM